MSIFSALKLTESSYKACDLLSTPLVIVVLWFLFSTHFISAGFNFVFLGLIACCFIGILISLCVYSFICYLSSLMGKFPLFAILSVSLIAIGLITLFENYQEATILSNSSIYGVAFIIWGIMLDGVVERTEKKYR